MTLTPNPSSPFATAAADTRHIFPSLFGNPEPGMLVLTGCDQLAVVPTEPLQETAPGASLPDGLCPACVTAMNTNERPASGSCTPCRECGLDTRQDGLCALCRMEAHDEWWAQQQPAQSGA